MEFIDRQDELQRLRRAGAREGGLVVLWGRRRVGKTRLLVEWCGQEGLYWVADTSAAPLQIRNFAETVAARRLFEPYYQPDGAGCQARATITFRIAR